MSRSLFPAATRIACNVRKLATGSLSASLSKDIRSVSSASRCV
jgi:hypothetical protein